MFLSRSVNAIKYTILDSLLRNNNSNNVNHNNEERRYNIPKFSLAIVFGLGLSCLSVGNGYFVKEIQKEEEMKIPLLLNASYYFLIFLIYFFVSKCRIKKPKKIYLLLSFIDSQANFVNIWLFSFIDFRFPFIINVLSTVWTVVFTLILIRTYRYLKNHIIGIVLCVIGVIIVFIGTFNEKEDSFDDFKKLFTKIDLDNGGGLLLCLLVSVLYGLNVVLMEKYVSSENDEIKSYCIWLGIFGFFISVLESFTSLSSFHKPELKVLIDPNHEVGKKFIIFWVLSAVFLAAMTSLAPFYIQKFQATMYNISLAFTILWSFILDLCLIEENGFKWYWFQFFYLGGLAIIIIGLIIFFKKDRIRRHDFNYS